MTTKCHYESKPDKHNEYGKDDYYKSYEMSGNDGGDASIEQNSDGGRGFINVLNGNQLNEGDATGGAGGGNSEDNSNFEVSLGGLL